MDLFNYSRRPTWTVRVGDTPLGGDHPIRVQSMTNTSTMDTPACVAQARRIVDAGGEYVRLTAQGTREAENLRHIHHALREQGYSVPLVADIHFNPRVADVAAQYVEKVRINPGNYVDPGRTFRQLTYTDQEYAAELQKIRQRLVPFLRICRQHGTAIRIGVNHGSLSDRIMSRYGDTPRGMVESCMEFLRICIDEDFRDVVISIKASNAGVMVRTVRLLVYAMDREDMHFPLHIGVTEAGDGEDGRVKSALGIGALLADGLGDTVRVSLSEPPEAEIPVARKLVDYVTARARHPHIDALCAPSFDYLDPRRRATRAVGPIGGNQVPVVLALAADCMPPEALSRLSDAARAARDLRSDAVRTPDGALATALDASQEAAYGTQFTPDGLLIEHVDTGSAILPEPIYNKGVNPACADVGTIYIKGVGGAPDTFLRAVRLSWGPQADGALGYLRQHPDSVAIVSPTAPGCVGEVRALIHRLMREGLANPAIIRLDYCERNLEDLQIKAAADMGALVFDGLVDGILLTNTPPPASSQPASSPLGGPAPRTAVAPFAADASTLSIAFSLLQAGRLRTTRTEYISCPSCGRTLYDLQQTIARIKAATSHLVGLKIGIMGCIVNGPGEMADADYGYVGAAPGRVNLYRRRECVEHGIPEAEAVDRLIDLIKQGGDWREAPKAVVKSN